MKTDEIKEVKKEEGDVEKHFDMKDLFMRYLEKEKNVEGSVYELGDSALSETGISFNITGLTFVASISDVDPHYFRLLLPAIYSVSNGERNKISSILVQLGLDVKAVKGVIVMDKVSLVVENYIYSSENIFEVFEELLTCLQCAVVQFAKLAAPMILKSVGSTITTKEPKVS